MNPLASFLTRTGLPARMRGRMRRRFGVAADRAYSEGDMKRIASYAEYRRESGRFALDETTWNDLNMDELFRRINSCQTLPGEQTLYLQLRMPLTDRREFERRRQLIDRMERDEGLRLRVQLELARLVRRSGIDLTDAFRPGRPGRSRLPLYFALDLSLFASVAFLFCSPANGFWAVIAALVAISLVYSRSSHNIGLYHYLYKMAYTAGKLAKLAIPDPDLTAELRGSLKKLALLRRAGALLTVPFAESLLDLLSMVLMLDLILYEFTRRRIDDCRGDLESIHRAIGTLDSAVAAASYRAGREHVCVPDIDFENDGDFYLDAENMVHPLIPGAVPNSLHACRSLLLTGSNASGKSTFLKTVAVNAVLAQSLCTCLADSFRMPVCRVFSSIALRDDIQSGESYYIVEIRSLKRILDQSARTPAVLCIVDEVLRGTNTVERIAASSVLLDRLGRTRGLCVAATHDLELCSLLSDRYDNYHFQESIREDRMIFDYRLREGPSTSRNAIRLLEIMGYDPALAQSARDRAHHFAETGRWGK